MDDDEKIATVATGDEFRIGIIDRLTERLGRVPTQDDLDLFLKYLDGALSEEASAKRE
jgi:hypothetical protein